jgi:hypothetical protein
MDGIVIAAWVQEFGIGIVQKHLLPRMAGKPDLPVCEFHFKRRLWWYKGSVFDRDEAE